MVIAFVLSVMETLAITNWNEIVSPMFDVSCCFLIVQPDGMRSIVDVRHMSLFEKAAYCSHNDVKVIICGAISTIANAILQDMNIMVLSWVRGPVEEIICAYQNNVDITDCFSMPGCNRGACGRNRRVNRGCDGLNKHSNKEAKGKAE